MSEAQTELLLAVGVSDRQWRDLLGVLKVQGQALDKTYLIEWAGKLEVADLLEKALQQSDLT